MTDVLIIGAGIAGLSAARTLLDSGRAVTVLDKGRGVGGRLATRRIDDATFDHGAQFFTVRGDAFRAVIDLAINDGVVDEWCRGFGTTDGYPRYRCPAGMNTLAKWLASDVTERGGVIHTAVEVRSLEEAPDGWAAHPVDGETHHAADVILTAPVPQSLDVMGRGELTLDPKIETALRAIAYKPTLALLVSVDGPAGVPQPGGVQQTEADLFTFIADNRQKGVSATTALTFHVNGAVSGARWDDEPDVVMADLLDAAKPWLGSSTIRSAQLKKWRYAGPLVPHPEPCVLVRAEPGRLVLAGDAFAGPKVEGAFNSGRAAGRALAG